MWSVECFGRCVVDGGYKEFGGEAVGSYCVGFEVSGWVVVVGVAELVCERAGSVSIAHSHPDGDVTARRRGSHADFRAPAVPDDAVATAFGNVDECV